MTRPKKAPEAPVVVPWFKVWVDWADVISELTNEQAGLLFKAMIAYCRDGSEPAFTDQGVKLAWLGVKHQIRLDRMKYINMVRHNRQAGEASANSRTKKGENSKKNVYQKSEFSPTANTDGARAGQQVLTSVNEGRRKKEEGRRQKAEGGSSYLQRLNIVQGMETEEAEKLRISQTACDILKSLGERITLPKVMIAGSIVRDNADMDNAELTEAIRQSLADLPDDEE